MYNKDSDKGGTKLGSAMKILMIAPEPFLEPRGTPISVYQRLQMLSRLGHEVDLLTYHIGMDVSIPGVRIRRIPRVPFIKKVKIGPSLPKLLLDILLFAKALIVLIQNRYEAIHSHEEAAFFCVLLSKWFKVPHIYDMHSSLPQQLKNFNAGHWQPFTKLFEILERWVLHTCHAVITIGSDLQEYVSQVNPDAKQYKIENLPVISDVADGHQARVSDLKKRLGIEQKFPIVYTGSFESYQGLDLLLDTAKIVKKQDPDVLFILVGGRPEQISFWLKQAEAHCLEDTVRFTGTVPLAEVHPYLEIAEILVSPRIAGTSVPLKVYSYLFSGKPTVATNHIAHTQILTEDMAVLVEPKAEAFAEAIIALLRSPALRQEIGSRAKSLAVERYSVAAQSEKLARVYQTVQPSPRTQNSALP